MAVEILSIAAADYNPGLLLKALDSRGKPLLDVLIENEQKQASGCSARSRLTQPHTGGGACQCAALSDGNLERWHRVGLRQVCWLLHIATRVPARVDLLLVAARPPCGQGAHHQIRMPSSVARYHYNAIDFGTTHLPHHCWGTCVTRVTYVQVVLGIPPAQPIYEVSSFLPHWTEIILLFFQAGVLVSELSSFGGRSGLGFVSALVQLYSDTCDID